MQLRFCSIAAVGCIALTGLVAPASASHSLPKLDQRHATYYSEVALKRRFGNNYTAGYHKTVRCHDRKTRTKMRCEPVSWSLGDAFYDGWTRIWYSLDNRGVAHWNYAYKIKRINEYCLATGGTDCTKTYVVH